MNHLTQIPDLSFSLNKDGSIDLEQSAGCGEVDRINLHACHVRHRTNRIAQLQAQLKQIPDRIKQAAALSSDSDELAGVWSTQVDGMANAYAQRLHAERQSGRPARLDLASPEAHAFFFGSQIKKSLRQLALTANSRSFGAPLLDVESLAAELRDEEKRLRAELNELQLRG